MNDSVLRVRIPTSLKGALDSHALSLGVSVSDVVRDACVLFISRGGSRIVYRDEVGD